MTRRVYFYRPRFRFFVSLEKCILENVSNDCHYSINHCIIVLLIRPFFDVHDNISPMQIGEINCRISISRNISAILGCTVSRRLVTQSRYSHVKKASSYIAQYPVLRTVQSTLHFTSPTYLFTQTPSRLLWEASSNMLQLMREGCSYTYPPLSIARYSFIQLSELEQCTVKQNLPKVLTPQPGFEPGFSQSRVRGSTPEPLRSTCTVSRRPVTQNSLFVPRYCPFYYLL